MTIPDAVLFDFGDTLVSPGRPDVTAGTAAVLALARDANGVTVEMALEARRALAPTSEIRRRTGESCIEFPTTWGQRLVYESLGVEFVRPPEERELAFWLGAYAPMPPTPGITGFLDAPRDRGIPTGVVSNASFRGPTLEAELHRAGLRDRLGFVMSSADYGLRKPHPAMLQVAIARLGIAADRAWFCGDLLVKDVAAAKAAGAVAVWYAPGGGESDEPDLTLRHWDEATAHLVEGSP